MSKAEKLKNKFLISNFKETRCLKITKTVSFELHKNTVYFWHEISYFFNETFRIIFKHFCSRYVPGVHTGLAKKKMKITKK